MGDISKILNLIDKGKEFYNENEEEIDEIVESFGINNPRNGGVDIGEPVKHYTVDEDEINISVEIGESGLNELSIDWSDEEDILTFKSAGGNIQFKLPSDAMLEQMEEQMKNGVVSLTIPRSITISEDE